jgi:hypothetical protein
VGVGIVVDRVVGFVVSIVVGMVVGIVFEGGGDFRKGVDGGGAVPSDEVHPDERTNIPTRHKRRSSRIFFIIVHETLLKVIKIPMNFMRDLERHLNGLGESTITLHEDRSHSIASKQRWQPNQRSWRFFISIYMSKRTSKNTRQKLK